MLVLTSALLLAQLKPAALFDACVESFNRIHAYSVHIDVLTSKDGVKKQVQFDVSVKPDKAYLRMREPATGFLDHSDRRYQVTGSKFVGFDAVANEWIRRNVTEGKTPAIKLASELGSADIALAIMLDPSKLQSFFGGFRLFPDWRVSQNGDTITLERFPKSGSTLLRFAGKDHILSEATLKTNGAFLRWSFNFVRGGSANAAFSVPSDARHVVSFSQREAPPKYKSPEAKRIVEHMLKAYGALRNGTIDIKSDEGNSHLVLSGRRLRQSDANFAWAYDGVSLSMKNLKSGMFYRGKANRAILSEYVSQVGGIVDPLIRAIIALRLPYLDLFPSTGTVKYIGSLGKKADIIEVKSPSLQVSLFVRRDNHLLDSMESETVDRPGRVQTRNQRWFSYARMGEPSDASNFRILPGSAKVLPLPKLKILGETK